MIRKFKPGDWVKLKGKAKSPKMEVLRYVPKKSSLFNETYLDAFLECVWYENGERKASVLHQNKLIKMIETGGLYKV
ncbi:hypothetical protein [Constantimarinum furrinae]|uniref:DUF2158 domain-containing protein n=1 Tax=Constantimarinum furrinae TaxID=2562285 RepID=A0A7G8PW50_9FLAO|nr:hypothetical protein [Constantimarinum furrinae]QNJ98566.1 hypothetical protein ALE3EI_2019 [Constantimarinum furrinae]